jgi:hypothetical protein
MEKIKMGRNPSNLLMMKELSPLLEALIQHTDVTSGILTRKQFTIVYERWVNKKTLGTIGREMGFSPEAAAVIYIAARKAIIAYLHALRKRDEDFKQATILLTLQSEQIRNLEQELTARGGKPARYRPTKSDFQKGLLLETGLHMFGFSNYLVEALKRENIMTVRDLLKYTRSEIAKIKGMGKKHMFSLDELLSQNDLTYTTELKHAV